MVPPPSLDNPQSPNAIPPRTSSHGVIVNGVQPQRSVLRPLSETYWLAGSRRPSHPPQSVQSMAQQPAQQQQLSPHAGGFGGGAAGSGGVGESKEVMGEHSAWSAEKERILRAPYEYLEGHPGKDIRSQMIAAFNKWLRVPAESLAVITKVIAMLHTASLLVDDVEDSSLLRRGIPVAHSIFGTAQTINSANYIYFLALRELSKLNNPLTIQIYTDELVNLHRGQGMDLYWRDSLTCPSEADYLEMVSNKTGGLFRIAIKLMQAESSSNLDCLQLIDTIGILFQILDDHLNLSAYSSQKGLCEDLTEGKFSFPVIHAIRADPGNLVLMNILKQKTQDEQVKKYAVDYMERMGSFEYSRVCIAQLREKALRLVGELEKVIAGEPTVDDEDVQVQAREGAEYIKAIVEKMKVP